ncbi:MAG: tetratricopeptide repeat protein [Cyclobacteriaceae bacterium]
MDNEVLERKLRRYRRIGWTLALAGALFSSLGAFIAIPLWGVAVGCWVLRYFTAHKLEPKIYSRDPSYKKSETQSAPIDKQAMIGNIIIWVFGGLFIITIIIWVGNRDEDTSPTELPSEQLITAEQQDLSANARTLFEKGEQAFNNGDYDRAKKIFEEITRQQPANANAWLILGNVHYAQKNLSSADRCYSEALVAHPDMIEALHAKAYVKFEQQQYNSGIDLLTRALTANPEYTDAVLLKADCYYALEDYSGAMPHYRKAYELGSRIPELTHRLAWLEDRANNREEAVRLYRETLEKDPERKDIFKRLIELDPGRAKAYEQNQLD